MLKVLILEDEISSFSDYEMILKQLSVQVIGVVKSWKNLISIIKTCNPDFIILNLILDHIEIATTLLEELKSLNIPLVVCAKKPEEDLYQKAIALNAEGFFSLPLDKPAFTFGLEKLISRLEQEEHDQSNFLFLKEKKSVVKIPQANIKRVEIDGNYSYVFTNTGKKYVVKLSLVKLKELLNPKMFVQCHRSRVINLSYAYKLDISGNKIILSTGEEVEVGQKFKKAIRDLFRTRL